jgi:rhamnosyltransferase
LVSLGIQVDSVIVVDDGSPLDSELVLQQIEEAGFELLRSPGNQGIAAALNTGIRLALERDADFVLTLDQDSALPAEYVADCLAVYVAARGSTKVGIVCAESISGSPTRSGEFTPEGFGLLRVAIQSGFLISAPCLVECGLFDERLVIDYVDTEFCLRIAQRGYRVVAAPGTDIDHALGVRVPLTIFGIPVRRDGVPVMFDYHGPLRRYYITRNGIDLSLRYLRVNPRWVLSSLRQETTPLLRTISSGPHRAKLLLAVGAGLVHGLARRRGAVGPRLRRGLSIH